MNSRVKTLVGLVVLGLVNPFIPSGLTRADEPARLELGWDALKTSKIEIQNFSSGQGEVLSSYPAILHGLLTRVLSWDPKKQSFSPDDKTPKALGPVGMLRNLSVEFDVSDTQHFRKAWFHLAPQVKVRGLFAMHDLNKTRPFVILRMGIHGNVDELLAERFIFKAVYEDLDANLLVLENLTSHAFVSQNQKMTFGGMEEGLHSFVIMNWLADPQYPLSHLISSFHLIGVSLGGQGTFVTALLDQSNGHRLKSVLDFCPLINMEATFASHDTNTLQSAGIDLWNDHRLRALYDHYPEQLKDVGLWKTFFDFKPRFTPRVLKILNDERKTPLYSAEDLQKQFPKLVWPAGFRDQITKADSFYHLNDQFWKIYRGVKTPVTIYTTPKDFLVTNEVNTDQIVAGKQEGDFKSVKIEKLDRGLHCGLAPMYPWDEVVKMIRVGLKL